MAVADNGKNTDKKISQCVKKLKISLSKKIFILLSIAGQPQFLNLTKHLSFNHFILNYF